MIPKLAVASLALTGCGDGGTTDALGEALTSYLQCGEALTCPELANPDGNSCDDLWYAAYDVCTA